MFLEVAQLEGLQSDQLRQLVPGYYRVIYDDPTIAAEFRTIAAKRIAQRNLRYCALRLILEETLADLC
jgi:hypothetical protein